MAIELSRKELAEQRSRVPWYRRGLVRRVAALEPRMRELRDADMRELL